MIYRDLNICIYARVLCRRVVANFIVRAVCNSNIFVQNEQQQNIVNDIFSLRENYAQPGITSADNRAGARVNFNQFRAHVVAFGASRDPF